VDFTVYLPDEIGQRVRDEGLKISRLLRNAVLEEFARRDGLTKLLEPGVEVYELELEDEGGSPYVGRIKGRRIAGDEKTGIYATTDGRLIGYQFESFGHGYGTYEILNDPPEDLAEKADPYVGLLPEDEQLRAWATIGIVQVIDL
jgi:hypothetical protein